jgi:hypothetical protein
MAGNIIGDSALARCSDRIHLIPSSIRIFADEILGPAITNNQLNRNARITMTNNKFGRLRVIMSLLAINFLVVGKVHGAVLSHNTVGP